jgi:hypothetical protein
MDINALLNNVSDQATFLVFAKQLRADRVRAVALEKSRPAPAYGPDAGGWENIEIETFLGAAIAWAEDSEFGVSQGLSVSNPWKQFAVFLYCGKIYE